MRLLTEHYEIRTTTQDTVMRDVLPEFAEAAHRAYGQFVAPEGSATDRMIVYVFGTREEWAGFTRRFVPEQADTYLHILSGGYMDQATATSVFWDVKRDYTLSLLAHEGLHQYLARHRPGPIPAWLNEGLATQFEAFDLDGPRPIFRPQRNLLRRNSLREALTMRDGMIPLRRFLSMHAGEAVVRTGSPARRYYAQAWLTVLLLRTSPHYRDAFSRLLADAGTPRMQAAIATYRQATPDASAMSDGEIAFRRYITGELEHFADDLRAYGRDLVF